MYSSILVLLHHLCELFVFRQFFYLAPRLTFLCSSCNNCTLTPTCTHHTKHLQFMLCIPPFTVSHPVNKNTRAKQRGTKAPTPPEVKKPLTPLHPRFHLHTAPSMTTSLYPPVAYSKSVFLVRPTLVSAPSHWYSLHSVEHQS
jgi:hypothetical protein